MKLPRSLLAAYNVIPVGGRGDAPAALHLTCPKCDAAWALQVPRDPAEGFNLAILAQLDEHRLGHEEVTKRVRYLRGRRLTRF